MAGMFGAGAEQRRARAEAERQADTARMERQTAAEDTARSQQKAEGGAGSARTGRNLLIGDLSRVLKDTLGF